MDGLPSGDWAPDDFTRGAEDVTALIGEYFEGLRECPVSSDVPPSEIRAMIPQRPPVHPEPFSTILEDTRKAILPNLTHWNHPRFFGYFAISGSSPGILADMLTSALNVNVMLWRAAPSAAVLEEVVLGWMAEMVGYPPDSDGVLVNGASLATLYALAAARDQMEGLDVRAGGLTAVPAPLRVYASDQAHSSVDKAVITLGIGQRNLVSVRSDHAYRMDPAALDDAIRRDLQEKARPMAVVATVGTTAAGAADPVEDLAAICAEHGLWLHVDAAYGGFWRLVPHLHDRLPALDRADSIVVNPHKVLYAPLEVSALYSRRKGALANTFRLVPEYLETEHVDGAIDFMDFSPQLGRSFRALKLWWIVRSFGTAGLSQRLAHSCRLADELRSAIAADPDWELPFASPYPLVCLRYLGRGRNAEGDAVNSEIVRRVNQSGRAFVSHAVLRDGYVIRVSIGNIRTRQEDVDALWTLLRETAAEVDAGV